MRYFNLFFFFLLSIHVKGQHTAFIAHGMYKTDHQKKLILVNQDLSEVNAQKVSEDFSKIILEIEFEIPQSVNNFEYGEKYSVISSMTSENYSLYFTQLPIISITTANTIVDEPRLHAYFFMSESNQNITSSSIGIEYRGSWSQSLPKKSLRIEFWEDIEGNETKDFSLLGMRSDDDWNLQAMFNEPLRFHNKTCFELWNKIDTLHYIDEEPEAINGVNMKYVEIFINGDYHGVYGLGERIDRKQLKLKKHNGNIRGELYKSSDWTSATLFSEAPAYDNDTSVWSGFEYEHPEEEINWENLHDFVSFVANSSDQDFLDNYHSYINVDNAVNYFIFMNLIRATDNTGKNLYIARYNTGEPYFIVPWDLDGTFGVIWNGSNDSQTNDIMTNNLFNKLLGDCSPNGFFEKLQNRWAFLRQDLLKHANIMAMLMENRDYLMNNAVYERESMKWDEYSYPVNQLNYMSNWLTNRLNYLDDFFQSECSTLSIKNIELPAFSVFPNPSNGLFTIQSSAEEDLYISNILGQTIQKLSVKPDEQKQIDLKKEGKGIYLIHSNTITIRVVVE